MIAFAFGLLNSPTLAQSSSDVERWSRVGALRPGAQIRVEMTSGNRVAGTIAAADANRFTLLERGGKSLTVERSSVRRVTLRSRGRGALYGLLIGFGAGFITGATAGPYIADFGDPGASRRVKYGAGWGAVFGGRGQDRQAWSGATPRTGNAGGSAQHCRVAARHGCYSVSQSSSRPGTLERQRQSETAAALCNGAASSAG